MAKLSGMSAAHNEISKKIVTSIQVDASKIIKKQLNESLEKGTDSKGKSYPDKKESTKKSYTYKGYNKNKWLIASGKGKEVKVKKIKNGIQLNPKGKDYMKHVKQSDSWFSLSQKTITSIFNKIKKRLK